MILKFKKPDISNSKISVSNFSPGTSATPINYSTNILPSKSSLSHQSRPIKAPNYEISKNTNLLHFPYVKSIQKHVTSHRYPYSYVKKARPIPTQYAHYVRELYCNILYRAAFVALLTLLTRLALPTHRIRT